MAEVTISAVAAAQASASRAKPAQNAAQGNEASSQPSFSSVLKSRSQAQSPTRPDSAKSPDSAAAKGSGKQADARIANEQSDILPQILALLEPATEAAAKDIPQGTNTDANIGTDSTTSLLPQVTQTQAGLIATPAAALAAQSANIAADTSGPAVETDEDSRALRLNAQFDTSARPDTQADPRDLKAGIRPDGAETALLKAATEKPGSNFTAELAQATQTADAPGQPTHGIQLSASAAGRNAEALPQHAVNTPVASRGWAEEVGQKVTWIVSRDSGRAELVLTPPQMGRIEVSINMNGDQASASFIAASPAAREALQEAMPRLREVLAESGIQLGQTSVNAGNSGQAQAESSNGRGAANETGRAALSKDSDSLSTSNQTLPRQGRGLVDTFA